MSRAYSLKYPAEIKENMYFAIETFAGHPGLPQTCRLEENVLVSKNGPVIFTKMEHMIEATENYRVGDFHHSSVDGRDH
jgi:Xaa-Pro aminopeptidase